MTIYGQLEAIFNLFNDRLFEHVLGDRLPPCLITLQRKNDFFSANIIDSFVCIKDSGRMHEIIINPQNFGVRLRIEIYQALAHQMMHVFQHEFGTVTKPGSHDEQYLDFMNAIGLMPSMTGKPDGKSVGGKKMFNYPMPGGRFIDACNEAVEKDLVLDWYEVSKIEDVHVNGLLKELHHTHELLADEVDPVLLEIPLLVHNNIDVQSLRDCLRVDTIHDSVYVDEQKAQALVEQAIKERQQKDMGERMYAPTSQPEEKSGFWDDRPDPSPAIKDKMPGSGTEPLSAAGDEVEPTEDLLEHGYQIDQAADTGLDENDAAAEFLREAEKQVEAERSEPKPLLLPSAKPDEVKIVKSADEIAAILGVESADEKKPPEKKKTKFKYTCSCGNMIWGGLDLNVICGKCQLIFKCETLKTETNVLDLDY